MQLLQGRLNFLKNISNHKKTKLPESLFNPEEALKIEVKREEKTNVAPQTEDDNTYEERDALSGIHNLDRTLVSLDHIKYGNTKAENTLLKQPFSELAGSNIVINIASSKESTPRNISMIIGGNDLPSGFNFTLSQSTLLSCIGSAYDSLAKTQQNKDGGIYLTLKQLYNLVNGSNKPTKVRDDNAKEIQKTLEELSSTRITIDATEHQQYNKSSRTKSQKIKVSYTGQLIASETITIDGETYIHIFRKPLLFEYAEDSGQIIKVRYDELDLKNVYEQNELGDYIESSSPKTGISRQTQRMNSIRDFIFREKGRAKGSNFAKAEFLYDRLYKALIDDKVIDTTDLEGSKKQRLNQTIEKVLDALKMKGSISDWKDERQNKKPYKITIYL